MAGAGRGMAPARRTPDSWREVAGRLDALDARWAQYDAAAKRPARRRSRPAAPPAARWRPRVQAARHLEKALTLDVKLLAGRSSRASIADRVHAAEREESRTVALHRHLLAARRCSSGVRRGARLAAAARPHPHAHRGGEGGGRRRPHAPGRGARRATRSALLAREFNAMAASLDRQRQELLRAERLAAVGRISAQITHEIRNPLNAIGLNAELLAEELSRRRRRRRPAPLVRRHRARGGPAERASPRSTCASRGCPGPATAREDLNEILGGLLDFLAPELAAARVEVARELAPALPAGARRRGPAPGGVPQPAPQQPRGHARRRHARRCRTGRAADGALEVDGPGHRRGHPRRRTCRASSTPSTRPRSAAPGWAWPSRCRCVQEHGGDDPLRERAWGAGRPSSSASRAAAEERAARRPSRRR